MENVLDSYFVDTEGNVTNIDNGIVLQPYKKENGYLQLCLKIKGTRKWKRIYVHRLVAMAFIPNDNEGFIEVNHINENKTDNSIENLEWIDRLGNVRHGSGIIRQRETRTSKIFVYDFELNFVGEYLGMREASEITLGYIQTKLLNKRSKEFFYFDKPLCKENLVYALNSTSYKTCVLENIETKETKVFANTRDLKNFFDNKVNISDAINKKWLVRKKYRIYDYDYHERLKEITNANQHWFFLVRRNT